MDEEDEKAEVYVDESARAPIYTLECTYDNHEPECGDCIMVINPDHACAKQPLFLIFWIVGKDPACLDPAVSVRKYGGYYMLPKKGVTWTVDGM